MQQQQMLAYSNTCLTAFLFSNYFAHYALFNLDVSWPTATDANSLLLLGPVAHTGQNTDKTPLCRLVRLLARSQVLAPSHR